MNKKTNTLFSIILLLVLALTVGIAEADFTFGTPTNLGAIVNSPHNEGSPSISADGLELYFGSNRPGGFGGNDLWVTKRPTVDSKWGKPVNLGPIVNSSAAESAPSISADGLELYFCDWKDPRPGGQGSVDLWVTTRPRKDDQWGKPVNLGPTVNGPGYEVTPEISFDGLELYFESERHGGLGLDDLYVCRRATTEDDWGEPVNLGPTINGPLWEHCPTISADGLTLFFDLDIPGDLMVTRRAAKDDDWGKPVNLGHSASDHYASDISADGSILYFASKHDGGQGGSDIWQVKIIPSVNLGGTGKNKN
jgi:Tol biopolymer transport system component